ncbi:GPI mannosyltransferase 2 [Fulvia fulva]|uniref:GPI mannosyltransferase 2 n=1 Tax=Passalora fulva TaxID=5499 RepID=A0A9Q8LII2_PASFU|nr:GPI mannosyltransferase 2 [Fulvia fulva]KAK4624164.1 GPI mannosyltransferase 2 [Fulvia fulva]UJO18109.1 GPI mannosyltransferase 2 [Fulvia fulva]WPV15247.1 GPI mannosyltransferase 2 [Fulvia fulva]WPV29653.1 GPI mannosyltransferase 2 [Fulvia fulva]
MADVKAPADDTVQTGTTNTSLTRLTAIFCSWKFLLLLVAVASPGPGYDTSTQILLDRHRCAPDSWPSLVTGWLALKLTRWDAIYYTSISARGVVYEQEWAFNSAFPKATNLIAQALPSSICDGHTLAGILLSHLTHLIAVLVLYQLTESIVPAPRGKKKEIAFITACLHILSPAGLFLSAPYGESTFAAVNFTGMLFYAKAQQECDMSQSRPLNVALYTVCSGIAFSVAALMRSNGLLSGLILAWDAVAYIKQIPLMLRGQLISSLVHLCSTLVAGSLIALAYALPHLEAYLHYCTGDDDRPWCSRSIPSIYSWVQSHYWGVGFLRYWTLSNLPLFALAAPIIVVLTATGSIALNQRFHDMHDGDAGSEEMHRFTRLMARFALPQVSLAALAASSFHVQIINRISSGYPVWYIVLGMGVLRLNRSARPRPPWYPGRLSTFLARHSQWLVRSMVIYALVQGGLYASFMPPA